MDETVVGAMTEEELNTLRSEAVAALCALAGYAVIRPDPMTEEMWETVDKIGSVMSRVIATLYASESDYEAHVTGEMFARLSEVTGQSLSELRSAIELDAPAQKADPAGALHPLVSYSYCIVQDPADYWYVIPESKVAEWDEYYAKLNAYYFSAHVKKPTVRVRPEQPEYAMRIDSPCDLRFDEFRVDTLS